MPNRCTSCGKLCGLETQEPEAEVEEPSVDVRGVAVRVEVRLVRASECCGEEVKEANFEVEESLPWDKLDGIEEHYNIETGDPLNDTHDLEIDADDPETTERSEGKGRGRKSFYGFNINYRVQCTCDAKALFEGSLSGDMQASHFDEK